MRSAVTRHTPLLVKYLPGIVIIIKSVVRTPTKSYNNDNMNKHFKTPPTHFVVVAHFFLGGLVLATIIGTIVSVLFTGLLTIIANLIAGSLNFNLSFVSEQVNSYGFFAAMVIMAPIGARLSARYLKNRYRILAPEKVAMYSTWLLAAYLLLPWLLPGHSPLKLATFTSVGTDGDAILHLVATVTMVVSQFAIAYTFYLASQRFLAVPRSK